MNTPFYIYEEPKNPFLKYEYVEGQLFNDPTDLKNNTYTIWKNKYKRL